MNTVREALEDRKMSTNTQIVADHVRLKGSTTKRGQYIETSLYEWLVDRIVTCIVTSDRQLITSDELIEVITANPPVAMNTADLRWITLQVKNHLLHKKFLASTFEERTQQIRLTPEGKIYFGLC